MLESRNGSEAVDTQTIFGTHYVDEIVRWWKIKRGAMYVLQDANWNVTCTVDYNAVPLDRVSTTPYGEPTFDTETVNGDYDADGDTDSADLDALTDCFTTGDTGACRIFDYDDDGDIDIWDLFDFLALTPAADTLQRQPGRRTSPNHFPHAHQGLFLDEETLTYQNRYRQYNPWQKRFVQRDPVAAQRSLFIGGQGGLNLYAYIVNNPVNGIDPQGLAALFPDGVTRTSCGTITCECAWGDLEIPLYGDNALAELINGEPGCVTIFGAINCSVSCGHMRFTPDGIETLEHECCHACAASFPLLGGIFYLLTVLGDLIDFCDHYFVTWN